MRLLLALSPFLIFIALDRLVSVEAGLFAAVGTSAVLLLIDSFLRRKRAKILEVGTLVLFSVLAAYVSLSGVQWSIASIRLAVDSGLLLIVVGSMLIGQPFTIQYARESLPPQMWRDPDVIGANYVLTIAWAVAFAVMVAVDVAWVLVPGFSPTVVLVVSCVALFGALRFPRWYGRTPGSDQPSTQATCVPTSVFSNKQSTRDT